MKQLDKYLGKSTTIKSAVIKSITAHLTIFPPYLVAFLGMITLLEGKGIEGAEMKIQDAILPIAKNSWFWPVVNVVTFSMTSPDKRLVWINVCGLAWNSYLSYTNKQFNELEKFNEGI